MADFFADLTDVDNNLGVTIDCENGKFTIIDQSDYDGNDEQPTHGRADFADYKKITVTNQQGIIFTFATTGADPTSVADEAINPPSGGNDATIFTINNGDNVYTIALFVVPTWNPFASYLTLKGHHVFNGVDNKLYKALTDNSGAPPELNPSDWKVLTDETELPAKYTVSEKLSIICDLNKCIAAKVEEARCQVRADDCNPDFLCRSKVANDAFKLFLTRYSIGVKSGAQDWNSVETLIDCTKQICSC